MSDMPPAAPSPDLATALTAMLPDLSLGAVLGFATGIAVKFVGRIALIGVGLLFIAIQLLVWSGVVTVDWIKLQALTEPWFRQGGEAGAEWMSRVLIHNLPFAGAFMAGFLLGLRKR